MSETNGKISLRNSRINEIHQELKAIPILKDHGKMVYELGRRINILRVVLDEIEDSRKKLFLAHFETNDETSVQRGDVRIGKFNSAFNDILAGKTEIEALSISRTDMEKLELSPASSAALQALVPVLP